MLHLPEDHSHDKRVEGKGFAAAEFNWIQSKETGKFFSRDCLKRIDTYFLKALRTRRPLWPETFDRILKDEIPNLGEQQYANHFLSSCGKLIDKVYMSKVLSKVLHKEPESFGWTGKVLKDFRRKSKEMITEALKEENCTCWVARVLDTNLRDTLGNVQQKRNMEFNIIYQSPKPLITELAPNESKAVRILSSNERKSIADFSEFGLLTAHRHLELFAPTLLAASLISPTFNNVNFYLRETKMTCRGHIVEKHKNIEKMTFLRHPAYTVGLLAPGMLVTGKDILFKELKREALADKKRIHDKDFSQVINEMSKYEEKIHGALMEAANSIPEDRINKWEKYDLNQWKAIAQTDYVNQLVFRFYDEWEKGSKNSKTCALLVRELALKQEKTREELQKHTRRFERMLKRYRVEVETVDKLC